MIPEEKIEERKFNLAKELFLEMNKVGKTRDYEIDDCIDAACYFVDRYEKSKSISNSKKIKITYTSSDTERISKK